jgi:hypothetical protein
MTFFHTLVGIFINERKKIGIAFNTVLISTILPPRLMYLFRQERSRFLRCSKRGTHVEGLLGLAPIGRPRYLNGSDPSLQFRKLQAISKKVDGTLIPIRPLFQKLTLSPEANSKPRRIALSVQRLLTEASPIHNVSSAYWR